MAAKAASKEGSVFRCGANVIRVVVPVIESKLVLHYGRSYEGLRLYHEV